MYHRYDTSRTVSWSVQRVTGCIRTRAKGWTRKARHPPSSYPLPGGSAHALTHSFARRQPTTANVPWYARLVYSIAVACAQTRPRAERAADKVSAFPQKITGCSMRPKIRNTTWVHQSTCTTALRRGSYPRVEGFALVPF